MEELLEISSQLIQTTQTGFKRYLYSKIEWDEKLIGIKGARGTGKTTLLLQYLKEAQLPESHIAYFSLDEIYFLSHSVVEVVKAFYQSGGKIVVLDEVHKYPNWSREIKNLHDRYRDLQVIFTGSSIIDIAKEEGDLSRRAIIYELHGLSYREFLSFQKGINLPIVKLEDLINPGFSLRSHFPSHFLPLAHFQAYLRSGYFPFSGESERIYFKKLRQLIRTIVEYDMAEIKGFDIRNGKKLLQLLYLIAQLVPFKPNISALAEKTLIHRNSMVNYLIYLAEARLIDLQYPAGISVALLQKPEKIFLNNTNYLFALSENKPEAGTVRETFFNSLVKVTHKVQYSASVDFLLDGKFHFEVGGKNKSGKQVKDEMTWIVKDDLEYPVGKSLPLWVFGMLY
ncbi:ATP-binding protein [Algoriphagus confluentis]|uniref:AAA family ATPase n=1 Tax=Algoriphagus confluentis TaxID=1697556 RepID=A0ABQ6PKG2_9BACT|nr:AAA family ATPase [Algoriphagus confluentis]